jgi:hypothetical protein
MGGKQSKDTRLPRTPSKLDMVLSSHDMDAFFEWCKDRHATENPRFYQAVRKFEDAVRALETGARRHSKQGEPQALAKTIVSEFVRVDAPSEITLSQETRDALLAVPEGQYTIESFRAARRTVLEAIITDLLPKFEHSQKKAASEDAPAAADRQATSDADDQEEKVEVVG